MDCWVDSTTLGFDNSFQDVCKRGFRVPAKGLCVSIGNIGMGKALKQDDRGGGIGGADYVGDGSIHHQHNILGRRLFEFILCRATIGRSLPVATEEDILSEQFLLPPEFDSVFLKSSIQESHASTMGLASASRAANGQQDVDGSTPSLAMVKPEAFRHDYVLFDSTQIIPTYAIQFTYDPSLPENLLAELCGRCKKEPATLWCPADTLA